VKVRFDYKSNVPKRRETFKVAPRNRFYLFQATSGALPPLQMRGIFKIWTFYILIMVMLAARTSVANASTTTTASTTRGNGFATEARTAVINPRDWSGATLVPLRSDFDRLSVAPIKLG
jgi:hypothetical protein